MGGEEDGSWAAEQPAVWTPAEEEEEEGRGGAGQEEGEGRGDRSACCQV